MRKVLFAVTYLILSISIFSACSAYDDLSTPKKIHINILFTPESFCIIGYNDIALKAIETYSHKYGYEYSFCVPESIEEGMNYYTNWCLSEMDDDTSRSLFIFASKLYEEPLSKAPHPTDNPHKDILIFEVDKELPYAYSFDISYYGASYLIGCYYSSFLSAKYHIIAANPYLDSLHEVIYGFTAATQDMASGTVNTLYISSSPYAGLDEDDKAFLICQLEYILNSDITNIFIPYAGLSNLGVYRFSQYNHQLAVGVDCINPDLFSFIPLSMNKQIDLALDDFLQQWINGNEIPKFTFYDLESGKVVVDRASFLDSDSAKLDSLFAHAIAKEKEYYLNNGTHE